jgi:cation diffusion facilitator CzcD-associated flavoprotein CzcO
MTAETDTIIVGAGPAGLAVGAVLRRANGSLCDARARGVRGRVMAPPL